MEITSFLIKKLHGQHNVSVKIRRNRVVIVGVNGTGKTTIVNMMYFFLTQQWKKLLKYNFLELEVTMRDHKISLSRAEIDEHIMIQRSRLRMMHQYPTSLVKRIYSTLKFQELLQHRSYSKDELVVIAKEAGVPVHVVENILFETMNNPSGRDANDNVAAIVEYLNANLNGQVLYLPTYRRIEQDLKELFPELEDDIKKLNKKRAESSSAAPGFVELVQFGMEDVVDKINSVLNSIKDSSRTELNNLAGSYLRDVIRNQAHTYNKKLISGLDDDSVYKMLTRVEENTLNQEDKENIVRFINKMKGKNVEVTEQDKYLAHFLSKLIDIHKKQKEKETPINNLIRVCNKYLSGKDLVFDELNYKMQIKPKDDTPIEFSMLSSGEKQIVSLFSHLYLGESSNFYIIIDEPELSLSVEWQNMLLPDIWESKKCKFLVAVTHSPFIYENNFDTFATEMTISKD